MLRNWLKIALANYRRDWLATLINLLGLTVGLTGFILILLNWNDETSYEQWNPEKENIYMVENYLGKSFGVWSNASYPQMRIPAEQIAEIDEYLLVNTYGGKHKLTHGQRSAFGRNFFASEQFFEFFSFKKVAGSYADALEGVNQIALSKELALQLFNENLSEAIGEIISIEKEDFIVTVIYEKPLANSAFKPDYILKDPFLEDNYDEWGNFNGFGFFKVKPGTDIADVNEKLNQIQFHHRVEIPAKEAGQTVEEYLGEEQDANTIYLTRLDKIRLDCKGYGINKGDKKSLQILLALSILILILSAINFINLKTAQASKRAKEIGIRKTLGGSRAMLILQFLVEAFLICLVAYFASLVLTEFLLPSFNKFLDKSMTLTDPKIFTRSILVLLGVSLFAGLIPAFYLSNFKPINTLRGNFSRSKHGSWLRNGILTLQLIISSFFIISSLIVYLQVNHMMNKDLGFNGDQAMVIYFQGNNDKPPHEKYEWLKREMKSIKGVEKITHSKQVIGGGNRGSSNVDYMEKSIMAQHGSIDLNYFDFYDIPILKGRNFDSKLASDTIENTIVNEQFVQEMGWTMEEALNKKVTPGFDTLSYNIIGVIKDFNQWNVARDIMSTIFFNYDRNWNRNQVGNIQLKIDAHDIEGTVERIERFWETEVEPGYPIRYAFINKQFAKTFARHKKQQKLFNILSAIVLTVALLGLFALSTLLIEQKLKTVAIKKMLGASTNELILDLTRQFLIITGIAVFISMPISYYFMNEWLKDYAYRIDMPWWPFLASLLLLLTLTFLVVSIRAYRATKISLVNYLKYE